MIEYAIVVGVGLFGAVLMGMIGIGTALLCVPTLIFVLPHLGVADQVVVHTALGTAMLAISLQSVTSAIAHHRRGNVHWRVLKVTIPGGIAGVVLGVSLTTTLPGDMLRVIFALFILVSAGRLVFARTKASDGDGEDPTKGPLILALGSGAIGFFASFIGAGGGVFAVPFFHWCGMVTRKCVGTSNANGLPISLAGALTYAATGYTEIGTSASHFGYIHLPTFALLAISGMIAAPLGAKLAHVVPARVIKTIFAVLVVVIATKMLVGG
ncbi:MAG: sulfite exporter TauE/SafE family protein [Rhodospirillales bacterium]|nr:sulfite exporter TauE/SafE family protein [Rhodospirillales bacterium]